MNIFPEDKILHIVFDDRKTMNIYLSNITNSRESNGIKINYSGHNFPYEYIKEYFCSKKLSKEENILKIKIKNLKVVEEIDYVIGYVKNDKVSKQHELLHAKFYIDKEYRNKIYEEWNNLSDKKRKEISTVLNKIGYQSSFYVDEFQTYLYSESKRKNKNYWNI